MSKKRGFTIIEVVLVLGIAGLIFMMAFIALPSLWASQRDADRKAHVMEFVSDIKTYQTNNSRGALPTLTGSGPAQFTWDNAINAVNSPNGWPAFVKDYVNRDLEDPEGIKYNFYIVECLSGTGGQIATGATCAYQSNNFGRVNDQADINLVNGLNYTMYVAISATCDGDHAVRANSSRSVAVVYVLERGGRYCYNT